MSILVSIQLAWIKKDSYVPVVESNDGPNFQNLHNLRKCLPGMAAKVHTDVQQVEKAARNAKQHPSKWCPTCESPHGFGTIKVEQKNFTTEQCETCEKNINDGFALIREKEGDRRMFWMRRPKDSSFGEEGVLRVTTEVFEKVLECNASKS